MGLKSSGRTANKLPKINLKCPNKFVSYLRQKHQHFIFAMIAKEGYKNQSEVTNEAYRLMEERYKHVHGDVKFKKLMDYGRQIVEEKRNQQGRDNMSNFKDGYDE